jgi:hypothetical protein
MIPQEASIDEYEKSKVLVTIILETKSVIYNDTGTANRSVRDDKLSIV